MDLINDGITVLLALAPAAALVSVLMAGLALRNQGSFFQNGRFPNWMLWAIVFVTLPQLLMWFAGIGISVPIAHTNGTALFNVVAVALTTFVRDFLIAVFAPVMAAWLVLRAITDIAEHRSPLFSILAAMFLLSIPNMVDLLQSWNSGTKFATTDVLAGLWNYTASRIFPVAAGLAIIGAILNFAFGKPSLRLVCCAGGFLTVTGFWRLIHAMMT